MDCKRRTHAGSCCSFAGELLPEPLAFQSLSTVTDCKRRIHASSCCSFAGELLPEPLAFQPLSTVTDCKRRTHASSCCSFAGELLPEPLAFQSLSTVTDCKRRTHASSCCSFVDARPAVLIPEPLNDMARTQSQPIRVSGQISAELSWKPPCRDDRARWLCCGQYTRQI